MTGDLDFGINKIFLRHVSGNDALIYNKYGNSVSFRNALDTIDLNIGVGSLGVTNDIRCYGAVSVWQTAEGITKRIDMKSYDTAYRKAISLVGGRADIPRAGDIIPVGLSYNCGSDLLPWFNFYTQQVSLNVFTDATRPAAASAGRVIYNSDDNGLNIDDGTNWRDTDGNIT